LHYLTATAMEFSFVKAEQMATDWNYATGSRFVIGRSFESATGSVSAPDSRIASDFGTP
jgi:hypothetical protein